MTKFDFQAKIKKSKQLNPGRGDVTWAGHFIGSLPQNLSMHEPALFDVSTRKVKCVVGRCFSWSAGTADMSFTIHRSAFTRYHLVLYCLLWSCLNAYNEHQKATGYFAVVHAFLLKINLADLKFCCSWPLKRGHVSSSWNSSQLHLK